MVDLNESGYKPSKALKQYYSTGNQNIIDSQLNFLGQFLYNYEKYGESGINIFEKSLVTDYLKKGKIFFDLKKDIIIKELKNQNICDMIKSPEFRNTEKLVLFINGIIGPIIGMPIAISLAIAEIIVIYGVEKFCECK